ncbi:MAG: response regulator [Candidatus Omnitrophota bacterium]|jgi:CheY-like chemotaxis protein|nr:MAG: response regulator [Candidatus Omnitrophota bacterium]
MKILLVDDDPDMLLIVSVILKKIGGFEVIMTDSGRNALVLAETESPDIILMDYMMEDMDGPALLEELRRRESLQTIPVIFLTALSNSFELENLYQLGAKGVIRKPFHPDSLVPEIQRILGSM